MWKVLRFILFVIGTTTWAIKTYILNYSNKVGWKNEQNKSCRSRWFLQLCCWWPFHLKSFSVPNFCSKLSNFEIKILNYKKIWRNDQIKVVHLDELQNFFVDNFSIWNHLLFQNFIWSSYILKFKFWIVHTISKEEITKTKVVDLDEI